MIPDRSMPIGVTATPVEKVIRDDWLTSMRVEQKSWLVRSLVAEWKGELIE